MIQKAASRALARWEAHMITHAIEKQASANADRIWLVERARSRRVDSIVQR